MTEITFKLICGHSINDSDETIRCQHEECLKKRVWVNFENLTKDQNQLILFVKTYFNPYKYSEIMKFCESHNYDSDKVRRWMAGTDSYGQAFLKDGFWSSP